MIRRKLLALALSAAVFAGVAPARATGPTADRLYLLAADTGYLSWSTDPHDPEAGLSSMVRTCGVRLPDGQLDAQPCLVGLPAPGQYTHNLFFRQGALIDEPIVWSSASPLRFRFELGVSSLLPYTVHLVLQKGTAQAESPAATETSPGVWEGSLSTGAPLEREVYNFLGIRVRTQSPRATFELQTRGASYVELPRPFAIRSVPQLLADDAYAPAPSRLQTAERSFDFNDGAWTHLSFVGDTSSTKVFAFPLPANAEAVVGWVEGLTETLPYSVGRGHGAGPENLELVTARLLLDDEEIEHGGPSFAGVALPAGSYAVEVESARGLGAPYEVHVVLIYGERTLSSMRWQFSTTAPHAHRSPYTGVCPAAFEQVPQTAAVTTFAVDLDWDNPTPTTQKWTLRFSTPGVGAAPCGENGNGDRVRFVYPGRLVWGFGATPAHDQLFVAPQDVLFEMEVRYAYSPLA